MVHEGRRSEGDGTSGKQAPQFSFTPPTFQDERGMSSKAHSGWMHFLSRPSSPLFGLGIRNPGEDLVGA